MCIRDRRTGGPINGHAQLNVTGAGPGFGVHCVDLKVDEATRSLDGLSPAELDDIKKLLRDQIATDPGLMDLARASTGAIPDVPSDD